MVRIDYIRLFGFTKFSHLDNAYTSLSFFQDEFEDYITEIAENEEENEENQKLRRRKELRRNQIFPNPTS